MKFVAALSVLGEWAAYPTLLTAPTWVGQESILPLAVSSALLGTIYSIIILYRNRVSQRPGGTASLQDLPSWAPCSRYLLPGACERDCDPSSGLGDGGGTTCPASRHDRVHALCPESAAYPGNLLHPPAAHQLGGQAAARVL